MTDTNTNHEEAAGFRLLLTPDRPALNAGEPTTLRLLARVQAPNPPAGGAPRTPIHLALVLDRSGSMSGEPLAEAKRCARDIVEALAPGDRAAIYAFDDEVACIAPLTPARDKLGLVSALSTIESGGTTNLHGGWRAGADELAAHVAGQDLHRVVLLSDGCANAGIDDAEEIAKQCKELAQRGVSTSTYGLGHSFNEQLMLAMATAGRGNAYYGQTAADLAEPFAAEFALLTSLCARGLVMKVTAPADVAVRVRNDYEPVAGETAAWRLPDLAFAAEAWALLELDVPASYAEPGRSAALAVTVALHAAAPDSTPLYLIAAVPSLAVVAAAARRALPADELVASRELELAAADALAEVRAAIDADNWERAGRLADDAATRFGGHPWAAAIVATMRRLIGERDKRLAMKEASYAHRSLNVRLSVRDEGPDLDLDRLDLPYLDRKAEQGRGRRSH